MPNEQKKCCPLCETKIEGAAYWICSGGCKCHTPTEEKIKYTKIAEGTPFEITQIKPTPTEVKGVFNSDFGEHNLATDLPTPTVSKMIDIDEVIGMIEGMKKAANNVLIPEESLLRNANRTGHNSALSSLKQKLEELKQDIKI